MKYWFLIINIGLILFLSSCNKDAELQTKEYPCVITNEPIITEEGAAFSASLSDGRNQKILKYGFVWSTEPKPVDLDNSKFYEGNLPGKKYSYTQSSSLVKGQTYYLRACVITDQYKIYGNEVSFVCLGSLAPEIYHFEPDSGFDGTEIVISGKNFGYQTSQNKVYIHDIESDIISATESQLIVKSPKTSFIGKAYIRVEVAKMSCTATHLFKILGPMITQMNPKESKVGDTILINGNYFLSGGIQTQLFFDDIQASIVSVTDDELQVIVPYNVNPISKIKLINGTKEISFNELFTRISSWTKLGKYPGGNLFDAQAFVINSKAYVLFGNLVWEFDIPLQTWTKKNNYPGYKGFDIKNVAFAINGKGYCGFSDGDSILWEYEPVSDSWNKKTASIRGIDIRNNFVSNSKVYVLYKSSNDLYEYDPVQDTWRNLSSIPKDISEILIIRVPIGDKVYLSDDIEFYEFDTNKCIWNKKSNLPFRPLWDGGFRIDDNLYCFEGDYYGGTGAVYEYNPSLDIWVQKENIPSEEKDKYFTFSYSGKAYLGPGNDSWMNDNNDFWMFDP
jgi:hypothetical protein